VKGVDLFINARTDLFLGQQGDPANSIDDALDRATAYAAAGASGFFIPGLRDDALIGRICDGVTLPVNVMVMEGAPSTTCSSELGVARVSYGDSLCPRTERLSPGVSKELRRLPALEQGREPVGAVGNVGSGVFRNAAFLISDGWRAPPLKRSAPGRKDRFLRRRNPCSGLGHQIFYPHAPGTTEPYGNRRRI
jgi:hypothetical protein